MELRNHALVAIALLGGCSTTDPGPTPGPDLPPPHHVLQDGPWELRIWYRKLGTHSETQHGVLLQDGAEVVAARVGEVRETSLGPLRYYGPPTSGMPWEPTGWNYADRSKIVTATGAAITR